MWKFKSPGRILYTSPSLQETRKCPGMRRIMPGPTPLFPNAQCRHAPHLRSDSVLQLRKPRKLHASTIMKASRRWNTEHVTVNTHPSISFLHSAPETKHSSNRRIPDGVWAMHFDFGVVHTTVLERPFLSKPLSKVLLPCVCYHRTFCLSSCAILYPCSSHASSPA